MDKLDAEFTFGRQALDLRAYRQQLLSENIANADTPGYKARDLNFASTLSRTLNPAVQGGTNAMNPADPNGNGAANSSAPGTLPMRTDASDGERFAGGALKMSVTSSAHMAGVAGAAAAAGAVYGTPQYRIPNQASMDGNTVELDSERVNFADNALHYETGLTVINQQIKTMLAAVAGNG